jgi:TNF receptor-associated factor 4
LTWKLKILGRASDWFAIGITDETNIYQMKKYNDIGHLSYLISANGILYNSHDAE